MTSPFGVLPSAPWSLWQAQASTDLSSPSNLHSRVGVALPSIGPGGFQMNRSMFNSARILLCGLFLLCVVGAANAQFKAGIQGTVTDSGGGLIPEAKMTLTN